MLGDLLKECYEAAVAPESCEKAPRWLNIQQLALSNEVEDAKTLHSLVLEAAGAAVRLPIIRKAVSVKGKAGYVDRTATPECEGITEGQIVIMDIVRVLYTHM